MERKGEVPICFVDHCADALVRAAGTEPPRSVEVVHVLDDDLPTRAQFLAKMRSTGWPGRVVPFNWRWLRAAALLLGQSRKVARKLPPLTLRARYQPLRYSNKPLHRLLGWTPRMTFDEAFAESLRREAE